MIRSMTGFGKAEGRIKGGLLHIEIKSFNHRFFEFSGRIPPELLIYEEEIKRYLKRKIRRGSLNILFSYSREGVVEKSVGLDWKVARRYFNLARGLRRRLGLRNDLGIKDMLTFPGVVVYEETKADLSRDWNACKRVLGEAVEKLLGTKEREGQELLKDLLRHVAAIERAVKKCEARAETIILQYKKRLRARFEEILGDRPARERMEEEAALFARNADISEELIRTKSHLAHMRHMLENEDEVGRKLDFVCQEIYREANTIGAKGNDYAISKEVVVMKSEIEKVREQVQNLE